MTFSSDLRDELATIAPRRACCRLAEVSALFHSAGTWHLRGHGELAVHVDLVSSGGGAAHVCSWLRELGVRSEIRTYHQTAFDQATRFQLHVELDGTAQARLREAGVVSAGGAPLEQPPKRVVGRSCCRGAYLRGTLLGSGSLSGPAAPQLELRTSGLAGAQFVAGVAEREGIALRVSERRNHALASTKRTESIADLLALAGASETALRLDEHAVVAATRADANRLANADEGNLLRTARAAQEQLNAIEKLKGRRLADKLQEIADLRERHPSLSLTELAKKCRPPITKAAAHHRMSVLRELAVGREGTNSLPAEPRSGPMTSDGV